MKKDGLSIIIITLNRCDELKKTLYLLKEQVTNFDWEVVICDQNSNDGTEKIVKKIAEDVKPYVLNYLKLDKNYGVAGGRNIAIKNAKYNNILSLDDDANPIDNYTLQKVFDTVHIRSQYNSFAFIILNNQDENYGWQYNKKHNVNDVFECNYYVGCAHLIKKDIFEKCSGYDDDLMFWGEEICYIMKMFCLGYGPVLYDGTVVFRHRVDGFGRGLNEDRFYFQVRNRLHLIDKYYPSTKRVYYKFKYRVVYMIKAIKYGWMRTYFIALRDVNGFDCDTAIRFKKQTIRHYLKFK